MTRALIGVICALRSEARQLGRTVSQHDSIEHLADGSLLSVTGMGALAANAGAERLVGAGAQALVSFGLAGGLDPQLPPGVVFLPGEVTSHATSVFVTDAAWRAELASALTAVAHVCGGLLISSATPVTSAAAKAALFASSAARAVDMESAPVGAVAYKWGLPFLTVRAIVDPASETLPRAVIAATRPGGDVSIAALLAQLVQTPADVLPLLRLAGAYAAANRALSAVARCGALVPRMLKSRAERPHLSVRS